MKTEGIKPETARARWRLVAANGDGEHGRAFRATRIAMRRSVPDVARITGIPHEEIYRLEAGRMRFPTQEEWKAWQRFLLSLCNEPECPEQSRSEGLCRRHYDAARKKSA